MKKLLILLLIFMVPNCLGFTQTQFTNLLGTENITLSAQTNITRYITLPTNAEILNFSLNFSPESQASPCYQEFANVSTDCGGLNTGLYEVDENDFSFNYFYLDNGSNMIDGDYDTYGLINLSYAFDGTTLDIDYKIPLNAHYYNSKWQIKGHNGTHEVFKNISIHPLCWDYAINNNNRVLQLFIQLFKGSTNITAWRCRDGTSTNPPVLTILGDGTQGRLNNRIYEEAMFWNIAPFTSTINQAIPEDYNFTCSGPGCAGVTYLRNYTYKYNSIGAVLNYSIDGTEKELPLPNQCFNDTKLQIRNTVSGSTRTLSCFNGTGYFTLESQFGTPDLEFYNNSVNWNTTEIIRSTLDIGNDGNKEWHLNNIFNTTLGIDNFTNLNNIIDTGCSCEDCSLNDGFCTVPFVFNSLTSGILQYIDLYVLYSKSYNLSLINEFTGEFLNLDYVSGAKIYETNESFIDIKASGQNNLTINFTNSTSFWVELQYLDNSIITRWVDVLYVPNQDLRICGNPQNTTHFEQIITSVGERPVRILDTFANCYIAADTTRFAYTTQQSLKAYTVDQEYNLEVFRNGQWQDLVGLEGTIQTEINIDTIIFAQTEYDISTVGESISINTLYPTNTTMQILYFNSKEDNINVRMDIVNLDTSVTVFSSTSFSNLNNITVFYDFALDTYDQNTLYKVQITKTDPTGESTITRFFNTQGKTGVMASELAFALSAGVLFFAFTFFVAGLSLSWLGFIVVVLAMGVLSFGIPTFYTQFLMGVEAIILIFILLVLSIQKQGTVAT